MSAHSHTPGPWRLDDRSVHGVLVTEDYHFVDAGDGYQRADGIGGFGLAFYANKADAELIASAPETAQQRDELLAACKNMIASFDALGRDGLFPSEARQMRAAIARAEKGAS